MKTAKRKQRKTKKEIKLEDRKKSGSMGEENVGKKKIRNIVM